MNAAPNQFYVMNEKDLNDFVRYLKNMVIHNRGHLFKWGLIKNIRTIRQNNALHLWFEHLANALNDAGLYIRMEFLGKTIDVPWCKDSVKERIWFKPMKAATGKESTADLDRKEISEIYDVLNVFFSENHGIYVPFPQREF